MLSTAEASKRYDNEGRNKPCYRRARIRGRIGTVRAHTWEQQPMSKTSRLKLVFGGLLAVGCFSPLVVADNASLPSIRDLGGPARLSCEPPEELIPFDSPYGSV